MTLGTILAGAVLLLGSLVQAIPFDLELVPKDAVNVKPFHINHTLSARDHNIYCNANGYVYWNEGSGGSPDVGDCQQLCRNIAGGGSWRVMEDQQHQIAEYHTCAYGVEPVNPKSPEIVLIGNGDIMDTITEAINRYGGGGKVGASGTMWCQKVTGGSNGDLAKMKFGIYHNKW
ncbi:putative necrosis-inducing factor domain containing protein [Rhypophila sp. PSN 637]